MEIKICNNYYLRSDKYNFILSEQVKNKKGELVFNNISYHPTITMALDSAVKKSILNSQSTDFKELVGEIRELKKVFERVVKEIEEVK